MVFLPNNATTGFLSLPTCHGKPTQAPEWSSEIGISKAVFDQLNDVIWIFNNAKQEWVGAAMPYPMAACRGHVTAGSMYNPLSLPWDTFFDPNIDYYSNNGTTAAIDGVTVQLGKNQMNAGASLNLTQATSGLRMTYRVGANGKAWLEGDGTRYYSELDPIPCTAGLASFHLIKFTDAGYYNLFEEHVDQLPREWIDTAKDIEPNGLTAIPGYDDGNWHTLITFTGPTGSARTKVWVDGTLLTNVASGSIGTNKRINQFNRFGGSCWKGGVGCFGFGSFDPTNYVADLSTWALANKPT